MQDPGTDIMRRTRRLTQAQSRYGCLTCKSRKVRCDETRPTCRRCTNSGFVCEGYTNTRPASPAEAVSPSNPVPSDSLLTLDTSLPITPETEVQQKLLRILRASDVPYIGGTALDDVIRTTSHLAPSSLTAIPALETLVQRDSGHILDEQTSRLRVDTAYGRAIRLFVAEIRTESGSCKAVFITGVILIAIELLQRRRQDAWKHLLGSRQWLSNTALPDSRSHDIDFLYRTYDLQSLLYSYNVRFPMVDPIDVTILGTADVQFLSFGDFEKAVVNVLHSAHVLLSKLHHSSLISSTPPVRQANEQVYQARLRLAVQSIDSRLQNGPDGQKESAYLILRNLCLVTGLELEQLRSSNETSWDQYEGEFQSIIEASEIIQLSDQTSAAPGALHLTLQPGIIAPLVLAAFKYRHPLWRRRAIACLRKAGIEGPFIGRQLAAIADRCVEIEESGSRSASVSSTSGGTSTLARLNVRLPPEDKRLAHCRADEDNGVTDQTTWPQTTRGSTLVLFLARQVPCSVLTAKVLTSTYFQTSDRYVSLRDKSLDTTVWRVWTETVEFDDQSG